MADTPRSGAQRALLRFLQHQRRITAADAARLEELAGRGVASVHELLEREDVISEKDLAMLLASTLRLRLIDLASFPLDTQVARALRENVATQYEVVPVRLEEGLIEVATANPLDLEGLKAVEFATGRRVQTAIATRTEVQDALAHTYRLQESLERFLEHVPDEETLATQLVDDGSDLRTIAHDAELPPVVKLADLILIDGIKSRASDVHVEPGMDAVLVRYRIDGILEDGFRFPKWVQTALMGRLKIMAKLDITERHLPQDGRIQVRYQDRVIDLRVSSLPTRHGEKITLRILDAHREAQALDRLGFDPKDMQHMREAAKRPQGLILVSGPTGSGKTTTLHALLREIFRPTIITIENPVEYHWKGINQVDINGKPGLTFASVLRSVLRQDPDVILVGEILDQETAQIACQAAQTGHLVLSTVHTNDPAATVTRLLDLGIEPYALASSLILIVAQRLVRRVCRTCSAPHNPSDEALRHLSLERGRGSFRAGVGCTACRHTGYTGRTGVCEVVPISHAIAKLIESGASESAIRRQARAERCRTLLEDAADKLLAGETTIEEVLHVVQVSEHGARCPKCQAVVEEEFAVCPHCSTVLRVTCAPCGKPLNPAWHTCPYCGAVAAPSPAPAAAPPEKPTRTYKALVVDDQAEIRHILEMTLEGAGLGLTVVTADGGEQALASAAAERPDIVVLDISMPGMDGFEVCRRLRADVRTAFVPILMLTAHDAADFVTRGFAVGADDYVTKPFRRPDLIARVRRMLDRAYGQAADGAPTPEGGQALGDMRSVIESLRAELARVESSVEARLRTKDRTPDQDDGP